MSSADEHRDQQDQADQIATGGSIVDFAINRARMVVALLILLLICGFYAYHDISKESSPDIDIPLIYVSMYLEGVSPEDSERLLLRPMEQELTAIEGVDEMRSSAYLGGGYVILEFQAGFDKDKALEDVRAAVDQARPELPESMEQDPSVQEINLSLFPIIAITLSGDVPERTLLRIARNLQDKLESIDSVLEANISGDREEVVEILIDPAELESYGLQGQDLLNFFNRSNRLVAAGTLDNGAGGFAIKVPGLFESTTDLLDMPLRVSGDSVVKVRDIAEIRRTFKAPKTFARIDGQPGLVIDVVKRSGENIIETISKVEKVVAEEQKLWPEGVVANKILDESEDIRTMLVDLQNNMISAVLLVMIVIVAALGLRAAGLVGVAIPGAFLSGVLFLYLSGLTVNIVVLFSLILSVGMLVDGAIVVVEYADRRMAEGAHRSVAFADAAKRMAWPIIASTATTLAAFAPLLFWPDIVGEFMKYMPITLIAVLSASLAMALIFVPVVGSLIGKKGEMSDPEVMKQLNAAESGNLGTITGFTGAYISFLSGALKRPGVVLLFCVVMLFGVNIAYGKFGKGVEFFPEIEPEVVSALVHARGNLSVWEEKDLVREVEERILGIEGIEVVYTTAGSSISQDNEEIAADVIGQIQIELKDWQERRPAQEIIEEIRAKTGNLFGIKVEMRKQEEGPQGGKDIQIELASRFPERLEPMVELLRDAMVDIGGFIDVEDSRPLPGIEWELQVDRAQASKFGLDITAIGNYVRMVTNGLEVAEYRPDDSDEEIDIVVRHNEAYRTIERLSEIRIDTAEGSVPISNFVKRVARPAEGTINRTDQRRTLTVKADLEPGINVTAKIEEIQEWMQANQSRLDPAVEIDFKGNNEDQEESQAFLMKAFVVALFIMFTILLTQFNNFYHAFLILSAVIMSTIGVMMGLLITGQPFGVVMSGVGVIALAGIIVNNNIVLIDTYQFIRKNQPDLSLTEVVLRTGAQRMRPVLLTTITTVLGLLPMVLQLNIDFLSRDITVGAPSTQWWVQLSTAITSGLIFSTILTLVVTPCALMLEERFPRFGKKA